jgi:hypothetical protein
MKNLKSIYRITETEKNYVFQNKINIHIELDKQTGAFVTGNIYDNEQTQILFKKLYKIAKNK